MKARRQLVKVSLSCFARLQDQTQSSSLVPLSANIFIGLRNRVLVKMMDWLRRGDQEDGLVWGGSGEQIKGEIWECGI